MQIRPGSTGEIKTMFKDQRFVDFFLNAILMYILLLDKRSLQIQYAA